MSTTHAATEQELPPNAMEAEESHSHGDHDDHPPESFNPLPSFWPAALSATLTFLPVGALVLLWGGPERTWLGMLLVGLGVLSSLVPTFGWFNSVIIDKTEGHFGPEAQGYDLTMGVLLFFLSELAVFGALFAYFFVRLFGPHDFGSGVIEMGLMLPALGTGILMISSITCELAHKALKAGRRSLCKNWLLLTMALGTLFLGVQGFEYGYLIHHYGFTLTFSSFSTIFYVLTGFHALHVMTGLIMLILVYGRTEMGHYTKKRHVSFNAASWYWHFVDVIWVFLFLSVYIVGIELATHH
ncbi:MAG: cytochrome c oxidase subunit 3 [Sumerlaeia bacterium]